MYYVLFSHTTLDVKPKPAFGLILNGHMLGLTFQPPILQCNSKGPYLLQLPAGMMLFSYHKPFQSQSYRNTTGASIQISDG